MKTAISNTGFALLYPDAIQIDKWAFTPILFIPWAAYIQQRNGRVVILKQLDLVEYLNRYPVDNPDEIDLEVTLREMEQHGHLRVIDSGISEH